MLYNLTRALAVKMWSSQSWAILFWLVIFFGLSSLSLKLQILSKWDSLIAKGFNNNIAALTLELKIIIKCELIIKECLLSAPNRKIVM